MLVFIKGWRPLQAGRLQATDCRMSPRGTRAEEVAGWGVSTHLKDKKADTHWPGEAHLQSPLLTHVPLTECGGMIGAGKAMLVRAVRIPALAESAADNDPEQSAHSMG